MISDKVILIMILTYARRCWSISTGLIIKDLKLMPERESVIKAFKWLEKVGAITKKERLGDDYYSYKIDHNVVDNMLRNINI